MYLVCVQILYIYTNIETRVTEKSGQRTFKNRERFCRLTLHLVATGCNYSRLLLMFIFNVIA